MPQNQFQPNHIPKENTGHLPSSATIPKHAVAREIVSESPMQSRKGESLYETTSFTSCNGTLLHPPTQTAQHSNDLNLDHTTKLSGSQKKENNTGSPTNTTETSYPLNPATPPLVAMASAFSPDSSPTAVGNVCRASTLSETTALGDNRNNSVDISSSAVLMSEPVPKPRHRKSLSISMLISSDSEDQPKSSGEESHSSSKTTDSSTIPSTSGPDPVQGARVQKSTPNGARKHTKQERKLSCGNCGVKKTPLWRRDSNGRLVCNACGLYEKVRQRDRPNSMTSPEKRVGQQIDLIPTLDRHDQSRMMQPLPSPEQLLAVPDRYSHQIDPGIEPVAVEPVSPTSGKQDVTHTEAQYDLNQLQQSRPPPTSGGLLSLIPPQVAHIPMVPWVVDPRDPNGALTNNCSTTNPQYMTTTFFGVYSSGYVPTDMCSSDENQRGSQATPQVMAQPQLPQLPAIIANPNTGTVPQYPQIWQYPQSLYLQALPAPPAQAPQPDGFMLPKDCQKKESDSSPFHGKAPN